MADSQKSMVAIVAIIAIVILVGFVIYFMMQESNDTLEIEIGSGAEVPALVSAAPSPGPAAGPVRVA
jgi:hypothetical protein